jgi:hypothetical protein
MSGKVYFGNQNYQTWIKAPLTGMSAAPVGFVEKLDFLNGGSSIRKSAGSHREFAMSWSGSMNDPGNINDLSVIKDFADGIYGDGPFHWVDPFAMSSNLFAPAWAAPALSIGTGWYAICPDDVGVQKSKVLTSTLSANIGNNTQGYPLYTAKYDTPGSPTLESDKFTFYIPEGYTLAIGIHGYHGATGKAFTKGYKNGTAATAQELTMLRVDTTTRCNKFIPHSTADKVEFYLAKVSSSPCTFYISGIIAQLIPDPAGTLAAAPLGKFISGRGTQQLSFSSMEINYASANINNGQIEMNATLVEVV